MPDASQQKQILRQRHLADRDALVDRAERSARIRAQMTDWPILQSAATVLCYVSARSEVDTRPLLPELIASGRRVVVPYCIDDQRLGLFLLSDLAELSQGRFGILEPRIELRDSKAISPSAIDAAILPGVAFDLCGNRLGYGKGYFDRLLGEMQSQTITCALAYECQITLAIPVEPHDLPIDYLITEERMICTAASS